MPDYRLWSTDLLAACPELSGEWAWLRDLMGTDDVNEIGAYNFLGSVFSPAAAYLLGGAVRVRSGLPSPGTEEAEDLLRRMYAVVEGWLDDDPEAMDQELRNVIGVELLEAYAGLSVGDLVRCAGPRLRAVEAWFEEQAETPESQENARRFQQWLEERGRA